MSLVFSEGELHELWTSIEGLSSVSTVQGEHFRGISPKRNSSGRESKCYNATLDILPKRDEFGEILFGLRTLGTSDESEQFGAS